MASKIDGLAAYKQARTPEYYLNFDRIFKTGIYAEDKRDNPTPTGSTETKERADSSIRGDTAQSGQ